MKKNVGIIILFVIILLAGCREGIIPPGENVGLLNTPVKDNFYRSYSLRVDAANLNLNVSDSVWLNSSMTILNISSSNYIKGSLTVNLYNPLGTMQYSEILDDNRAAIRRVIDNTNIDRIEMQFRNFTGNVNIKLLAAN
ncbi:MAG: hypothetical protein IT279_00640 [Ignavibacteriaceae bacterium]|nr:hypothetical protein [Ignavibacteriaceae bacterium]